MGSPQVVLVSHTSQPASAACEEIYQVQCALSLTAVHGGVKSLDSGQTEVEGLEVEGLVRAAPCQRCRRPREVEGIVRCGASGTTRARG